MTTEIVRVSDVDLEQLQRMAKMLAVSGYFEASQDATTAIAQMATKILAGRELGYGPFASVQGIHVIKGKPALSANLMAAAVKAHPHYDYKVRKMANDEVVLEFFEDRESLGLSSFSIGDANRAGTQNLGKFARNMLFARAMSNGVRWYCPDVFYGNAVYTPEELGARVDEETGEIIEQQAFVKSTAKIVEPVASATPSVAHRNTMQSEPPPDDAILYDEPAPVAELAPTNAVAVADPDNPFHDPELGVIAEANRQYGEIADRLTGKAKDFAEWAYKLHSKSNGDASAAQYGFLSKEIDKHTGYEHTHVLSVLCRSHITSKATCGANLAKNLLDYVLTEVPQTDENNQKVKVNGKQAYIPNPKFRQDYVDVLKEIAQAK